MNKVRFSCTGPEFVVFVKIELNNDNDNVVKENYSSPICWSENYSLRIFESSTSYRSQIPEGKIESDNEKKLQFINFYTVWATAEKIKC